MVAQLTAFGDHGQDGEPAQLLVVAELKRLQGELLKRQNMVEGSVWVTQPKIGRATPMVAQWTAFGDHGQGGEHAL